MSRRVIRSVGTLSARHPVASLLIVAVLTILSLWAATERFRVEMDVSALLPDDSIVAKQFRRPLVEYIGYGYVICALEIKDTAPSAVQSNPGAYLLSIRDSIFQALDDQSYFLRQRTFTDEAARSMVMDDLASIAVMTNEEFVQIEEPIQSVATRREIVERIAAKVSTNPSTETLQQIQSDPFNVRAEFAEISNLNQGPFKAAGRKGYTLSEDGRMMLLFLWPVEPSTDLLFVRDLKIFLDATRKGLYLRNPDWISQVEIRFTGSHVENAEGESDIRSNIYRSSIVSLVLVLLLFIAAFHQPEALAFVAIPLIVGVLWTLGLTSLLIERITQVTLTFAAIMIGLGIDFSIHLYNRFLEGRRLGMPKEECLLDAIHNTGPSIVAGAFTTLAAFVGLWFTDFIGFRELGYFGGAGILLCLAAMAVVLPAIMMLFTPDKVKDRRPTATLGLKSVTYFVSRYPRWIVGGGLVIAAVFGYHARYVAFNEDFMSLIQPSDDHRELIDKIDEHFEIPANQVFVVLDAPDLATALDENDKLYKNIQAAQSTYGIVKIDSLREAIPGTQVQRENLRRFTSLRVDDLTEDLRILAEQLEIKPVDIFDPFLLYMRDLQAAAANLLEVGDVPLSAEMVDSQNLVTLLRQYVFHDSRSGNYRVITTVYPPVGEWREEVPPVFLEQLGRGLANPPLVLGNAVFSRELKVLITRDLAKVVLIVVTLVFVYLGFYFHKANRYFSVGRALLAMIPVGFAILCMLGTMVLMDIRLSYLNIIAIPMIVGIGVDSAIHLLSRFYEKDGNNLQLAVERTGRAIVITSLTTVAGFGALVVANFQGIREVGLLCIIGTMATLFSSLVFLPAVLMLLDPKYSYSGGAGDEIG